MKPIAFKVRGGGNYSGTKGGTVRPNEKGGTGALWYIDKTFTIASTQDQFIATVYPIISPAITTCKGSRGGCSDEAIEEIKAVHAARQQQPFITKPQPMTTQPNTPQVPIRFLSVCSGMEAASVAWEPLGWKAVGFSEIEPFPCAILKHRFPNTQNYGSLTEHATWPISAGDVDLLIGGTPCQSYSVAGKRGGLNDPRGQLMLSFLDLAERLKVPYVVWENVPGVLSSGQPRGSDFATFLQGLVERGYGWAYRVLDAQYIGRCGMHSQGSGWDAVPQRRRRVFVVACRGPGGWESAASVLLKPESLCWHPAKGRKKGQATAPDAGSGVETGNGCWWDGGQVSQTLDAVLQKGQTMPEKNRFPAVLQPVVIDRAAFNQGINAQYEPHIEQTDVMDSLVARGPHAVGVPFRKSKRACSTTDNETWVEADASNTLNNFDLGDTRTTHAVVEPGQVIPTLTSKMQGQAGWAPYNETSHILPVRTTHAVVEPVIPIHDQATRFSGKHGDKQDGKENGLGIGQPGDPMNTLTQGDKHAVAYQNVYENHAQDSRITGPLEVAPTVAAKFGTGGGNVPLVGAMAVRRLTPTECERLQGFPDNWSRIPWKNKSEDQCPDGPRYKACGNSMAVPVMRWIGEQIARVEAEGK